ncbi:hypothetical protein [Streptomyces sp. NPDC046821]|uniref:hypothetical protein n=1 Tax=Streptomyces sp. NPDC046821 TaxID=3154702 RepID=UPI0033C02611
MKLPLVILGVVIDDGRHISPVIRLPGRFVLYEIAGAATSLFVLAALRLGATWHGASAPCLARAVSTFLGRSPCALASDQA